MIIQLKFGKLNKIKVIKSDLNLETMAYLKTNEISDYIIKKRRMMN